MKSLWKGNSETEDLNFQFPTNLQNFKSNTIVERKIISFVKSRAQLKVTFFFHAIWREITFALVAVIPSSQFLPGNNIRNFNVNFFLPFNVGVEKGKNLMSIICSVGTQKGYDWEKKYPMEYVKMDFITKHN